MGGKVTMKGSAELVPSYEPLFEYCVTLMGCVDVITEAATICC
jgi:hypothetical protein